MLLAHLMRLDCSRTLLRAGIRIEINSAMMPMTTSSSTSVNARRGPAVERIPLAPDAERHFIMIALPPGADEKRNETWASLAMSFPPGEETHEAAPAGPASLRAVNIIATVRILNL